MHNIRIGGQMICMDLAALLFCYFLLLYDSQKLEILKRKRQLEIKQAAVFGNW